jgi:hypothetical protein
MKQSWPVERYALQNQIEPLRQQILRSFPPSIYAGTVIAGGDEGPWIPAPAGTPSDDEDLFRMLKHSRWTDIPADFVDHHLGAFVLLTAPAFAAFIPAWLIFSLENNLKGAEFVVYTFGPIDPTGSTQIRPLSIEMFRALTPQQRRTVHAFLQITAAHDRSYAIREQALTAADAIEKLISVFESSRL